ADRGAVLKPIIGRRAAGRHYGEVGAAALFDGGVVRLSDDRDRFLLELNLDVIDGPRAFDIWSGAAPVYSVVVSPKEVEIGARFPRRGQVYVGSSGSYIIR